MALPSVPVLAALVAVKAVLATAFNPASVAMEAEIETFDVVPGCAEQRHHDRPDVTAVTRDEDPHYYPQESGYEFDGVIKPLI